MEDRDVTDFPQCLLRIGFATDVMPEAQGKSFRREGVMPEGDTQYLLHQTNTAFPSSQITHPLF